MGVQIFRNIWTGGSIFGGGGGGGVQIFHDSTNQVSITTVVEVASGKSHALTALNCQKFSS